MGDRATITFEPCTPFVSKCVSTHLCSGMQQNLCFMFVLCLFYACVVFSLMLYLQSDAISTLETEHDYKEEHFDFIQQHIRKFCLKCILFNSSALLMFELSGWQGTALVNISRPAIAQCRNGKPNLFNLKICFVFA